MVAECQHARFVRVPNFCVISDDNVRVSLLNRSGAALDINREPQGMFDDCQDANAYTSIWSQVCSLFGELRGTNG